MMSVVSPQAPVKKKQGFTGIVSKGASPEVDKDIKLGVDEPGCKDSPLLPRIAGCSIIQCDSKADSENVRITVAGGDGAAQEDVLDGFSEIIYYLCPSKTSVGSIAKHSESALLKGGFRVVFSGKDVDDFPLVTTQKADQWLQVSTYNYNEFSAYIVTAVKAVEDAAGSVEALLDEFVRTGRVVLTGVTFEHDKPTSESDRTLTELAMFLVRQSGVKINIEVHTDNQGDKQANLEGSQKQAGALRTWLTEHGVEAARVTSNGSGDSRPIADNATEEGRAKNRRIEFIKVQ